jgi:hypothetical protein
MNASTSAVVTASGGLLAAVKNTFKSYATASTVFGLHQELQVLIRQRQPQPRDHIPSSITRAAQRNQGRHAGLHLHEGQASKPVKISLKITRISCTSVRCDADHTVLPRSQIARTAGVSR